MTTRMLLVRHGQTVWNAEGRFRGQVDVPLDETGLWQAGVTGEYVAGRWPLSAVYASPLKRALQTADSVASAQGLAVQPLDGLLDLDFGEWGGVRVTDVRARWPDLLRAWHEAPGTLQFPGGESLDDVRQRGMAALQDLAVRHADQTVALVAHTVVNRVLLCAALDLGNEYFWRMGQDTCAVNLIEWNGKTYQLHLLNDTSHLWRARTD
jgi:broad specificity phosphatase PhoE